MLTARWRRRAPEPQRWRADEPRGARANAPALFSTALRDAITPRPADSPRTTTTQGHLQVHEGGGVHQQAERNQIALLRRLSG